MGLGKAQVLVQAVIFHHHVALKPAGADAHKGGRVAVFGVHVGLQFKNVSAEVVLHRVDDDLALGVSATRGPGGGRHFDESVKERFHPKVGQGGCEKDGCHFAF